MSRPSARDLPDDLRTAATSIARSLHAAGHQAWIVGGAPRDLALGNTPREVDMATDARPEHIEALFERTSAVGKAFGTIVVHVELEEQDLEPRALDVEVTTFRADGRYSDGRRPEQVTYGSSVEEDARRRDFTCNALYLDPLTDEFLDPERGLEDLAARRLRCVGEARARFTEDGLRLLRMARFAARLELAPTTEVLAAAHECAASLRGVSPERVLAEFSGMFRGPRVGRAMRLLERAGLLEAALPGSEPCEDRELRERRLAVFEALAGPLPVAQGLAILLDPDPLGQGAARREAACSRLGGLRPSRALRKQVLAIWRLMDALHAALEREAPRAQRLRWMREESWGAALATLAAWLEASEAPGARRLEEFERERATLGQADLRPAPWLTPADLAATGIARGPLWGDLLEQAESLQLEGELGDRAAALAWLARRAEELHRA